jgi:hypothetical protein
MHPQYYVPYEQEVPNALAHARPLDNILRRDPEGVQRGLKAVARSQDSVKFLPLRGRLADGAVLLDAKTGAPLEIVLVDPW